MRNVCFITLAMLLCGGALQAQDATFTLIPEGSAVDITPDGETVLIFSGNETFIWTESGGADSIGTSVKAGGISDDAEFIGGSVDVFSVENAALWSVGGGWMALGGLPGQSGCGPDLSAGYHISGDGGTVVGLGWEGCQGRAFYWTQATGMVELAQQGPNSSRANTVSGDGNVVGGWDEAANGTRRPAIWDIPADTEIVLNPTNPGEVWGLTPDGSTAVGEYSQQAFYWNALEGIVQIGILQPPVGTFDRALAFDVTPDGGTIVGVSGDFFPFGVKHAFLWTETDGMQRLSDLLEDAGATIPFGWVVERAEAISADGKTIVGTAFNANTFSFQGFVAQFPSDAPQFTRGDADGDNVFNGLQDALFVLAYQFQAGPTPPCLDAADADNDGTVNGLTDGLLILAHQFQGGPPPAAPYPDCGPDDNGDLGCEIAPCP